MRYKLYGMQLSWYTAKVRPYLQFKGIDFVEELPSLYTFHHRIRKFCGNSTVPVLISPEGEWLQDSSLIIERLEQRYPAQPVLPREPVQRFLASLIEIWGDEFWQTPAMHTRWYFYPQNYERWEAEAAEAFAPGLPRFLQRPIVRQLGARRMRGYLDVLGCTAAQNELIERWTREQCLALEAHFAEQPFLFGTRPSIADFGLLGPVYGHLGRDLRSIRVYLADCPHLQAWIERMNGLKPFEGDFLPDDQIPATLTPILRSVFDEMLPYLGETVRYVNSLLPAQPQGERLPRFEGEVSFPFAGGRMRRQSCPYTLWMTQRALDQLHQLPTADVQKVHAWLKQVGGEGILNLNIPRLRRAGLQAAPEWPAAPAQSGLRDV